MIINIVSVNIIFNKINFSSTLLFFKAPKTRNLSFELRALQTLVIAN